MSGRSSADGRSRNWREYEISTIGDSFGIQSDFLPLESEAVAPDFKYARACGVGVSHAVMPPLQIKGYGAAELEPVYHVTRVNQESTILVEGREPLRLAPNEWVINSSHARMTWTIARTYMTSSLHIASSLIGQYFERPMDMVGRRLKLPFELSDILGQIMDASIAMSEAGRFGEAGDRLGASFLNILALAPDMDTPDERSQLVALDLRRHQIKNFINRNFAKPGMSIEAIASHFQISTRYVQRALAAEGICPSEYLKKCRLEAAAERLRAAEASDVSITEVAFGCGFGSSAHFSTEFRRYSGLSPRDYRRRHQEMAAAQA